MKPENCAPASVELAKGATADQDTVHFNTAPTEAERLLLALRLIGSVNSEFAADILDIPDCELALRQLRRDGHKILTVRLKLNPKVAPPRNIDRHVLQSTGGES